MNVTILQPSYIPWRGYFHQILKSDLFIFYDDVQYDKHGWRNRNRIKTSNGSQWITIPVISAGAIENNIPINQIKIDWSRNWNEKHWSMISQSYSKSPFFKDNIPWLEQFFNQKPIFLADFTIDLTVAISKYLEFSHVKFIRSSTLKGISGTKTDRLIHILNQVGATHYISGPSAMDYIDKNKFEQANITLEFMNFTYPEYPQRFPPFDPQLSIVDLIFNTGTEAVKYIDSDYFSRINH
jgi:hypothetical protein